MITFFHPIYYSIRVGQKINVKNSLLIPRQFSQQNDYSVSTKASQASFKACDPVLEHTVPAARSFSRWWILADNFWIRIRSDLPNVVNGRRYRRKGKKTEHRSLWKCWLSSKTDERLWTASISRIGCFRWKCEHDYSSRWFGPRDEYFKRLKLD